MAKRHQTLHVRIPPYQAPRNNWRRAIHAEITRAASFHNIVYQRDDKLELVVILYMKADALTWHDVDNRLKDVMDALQGRAGGPKSEQDLHAVVPNDYQIYKVTIEKKVAPPQSCGLGHLIIKKHGGTSNKALHHTSNRCQIKNTGSGWAASSEFTLQVSEHEKHLYEANNPYCIYHTYQWPYRIGRHRHCPFRPNLRCLYQFGFL